MLTVATFREVQEAHLFAGRLRAEGIHASVAFQYHVGNNWAYSTALGGAIVQVTNDDYVESKSIERLSRSGEFKRQLEDVFGDLDDLRCPNCGATDYWKRRPIYQGILSIVALFSVGILPPWRWIYFCNVCGTKFGALYGLIGKAAGDFHFSAAYSKAAISDIPEMRQLRGDQTTRVLRPKLTNPFSPVVGKDGFAVLAVYCVAFRSPVGKQEVLRHCSSIRISSAMGSADSCTNRLSIGCSMMESTPSR